MPHSSTNHTERSVQQAILLALGSRPDCRLFRNNTGQGWTGDITRRPDGSILIRNPRPIYAGLHVGSGDLIGFQRVKVTPEMVGQEIGAFVSLEVKGPSGRARPEQVQWAEVCRAFGARAGIVRSVADAEAVLFPVL
jgi:hypothetical protein